MIDSRDLLKSLGGPDVPEKPRVTVNIERGDGEDSVWLSQCVDPVFDMQILVEGLATAICVAAQFIEKTPEEVLKDVINGLESSVSFHGKIERKP